MQRTIESFIFEYLVPSRLRHKYLYFLNWLFWMKRRRKRPDLAALALGNMNAIREGEKWHRDCSSN